MNSKFWETENSGSGRHPYTVPKAISRLEMFYNTPRKYPRYSLKFFVVHFLLKYLETFRDIGALLCGGGGDLVSRDISRYRCRVVGRGGEGLSISRHFEI